MGAERLLVVCIRVVQKAGTEAMTIYTRRRQVRTKRIEKH